jgi:hypothetical protein
MIEALLLDIHPSQEAREWPGGHDLRLGRADAERTLRVGVPDKDEGRREAKAKAAE